MTDSERLQLIRADIEADRRRLTERALAGIDLEIICKKLSRYCHGQRLRCAPSSIGIRLWLGGRGARSHWVSKETYLPDDILKRVNDDDFPQWLADELRGQGFPIETEAERETRIKTRHAEHVRANNKRISERRCETRARITTCNAPSCKEPITAIRASKKFCSAACRQRARRRWM